MSLAAERHRRCEVDQVKPLTTCGGGPSSRSALGARWGSPGHQPRPERFRQPGDSDRAEVPRIILEGARRGTRAHRRVKREEADPRCGDRPGARRVHRCTLHHRRRDERALGGSELKLSSQRRRAGLVASVPGRGLLPGRPPSFRSKSSPSGLKQVSPTVDVSWAGYGHPTLEAARAAAGSADRGARRRAGRPGSCRAGRISRKRRVADRAGRPGRGRKSRGMRDDTAADYRE